MPPNFKSAAPAQLLLPLQGRPLDYWPDKSIKWVLLDFFVTVAPNSQEVFTLLNDGAHNGAQPDLQPTITISETKQGFTIDTGAAAFGLSEKGRAPWIRYLSMVCKSLLNLGPR